MKIALLHYSVPPIVGGVESVIAHHARLMSADGHSVRLIAARGEALFLPEVIARVLNRPFAEKRSENSVLTERELEVLRGAWRTIGRGTLAIVRTPGPGGMRMQRSGAITPRRAACACSTIISMVAGIVLGWPWQVIARLSPTTHTSTPAASAHFAEV